MTAAIRPLLAREDAEGRVLLCAPAVGRVTLLHPAPSLAGPGVRLAVLERLGRREILVVPRDVAGRLESALEGGGVHALGYGDPVFVVQADAGAAQAPGATAAGHAVAPGAPGERVLRSPSDGVFYRRPSPTEPPFVEPGTVVRKGQPVGLIEVMKTFSQILYDGPDFPEEARVEAVLAGDGEEVQAGQPLVRLAPVS